MLRIDNIHTYYGESYILQGVSLEVKKGTVVALLGRNGMGKTTTMRSITGFTPPRRGKIIFEGQDITELPSYCISRLGIGLVPQGRGIFPSLSLKENLTISARNTKKRGDWNLDRVYSLFPILKIRSNQPAALLSGGEQQMLCIARALMTNPELLLMDEPSEGLAPIIVREIGRVIYGLKQSGFSILLIEQNISLALALADYVYIISKGVIVYESNPQELKSNEEIKSKYLGIAI
jgi:branched-chain amino acid transport system ATP-binding protein